MADIPQAALDHYVTIQRLQALAVASARRAWTRVDWRYISQSWTPVVRRELAPVVTAAQVRAAESGSSYSAMALAQQDAYAAPDAWVNPKAFGGYAADGRALEPLLDGPAYHAKSLIGQGVAAKEALDRSRSMLDTLVRTTVADAGRQSASVDIAARPGTGYVRMLNPPSCSRCTILAGRFYRWNKGFLRHPGCDCVHVASRAGSTQAALDEGLVDDPYDYFESLSEADQDRIFGKNSAQAIRDGSDIYRVENAKRGRSGLTTSAGTGNQRGTFASHSRHLRGRRLTPDGIYAQNLSREDTLALLEEHGYLFRDKTITDRIQGIQARGGYIVGSDYEGFGQMGRGGTRRADNLTAAQRRLVRAQANYDAALAGRNPYGRGDATPAIKAQAEQDLRRWLATDGEIFTR